MTYTEITHHGLVEGVTESCHQLFYAKPQKNNLLC